jgi:hypothetical protein
MLPNETRLARALGISQADQQARIDSELSVVREIDILVKVYTGE